MDETRGSVLIVDDEPAVRSFIATVLRGAGYQVTAVSNADEALAAGPNGSTGFDALITDVRLPGMSGPELVRRLTHQVGELPVVVISGLGAEEMREQFDGKEYPLLEKPFGAMDLLRCVEGVIETSVRRG
jgi:two-component system, NtrC family, C4-dicarboxylate transport response regulator DctD